MWKSFSRNVTGWSWTPSGTRQTTSGCSPWSLSPTMVSAAESSPGLILRTRRRRTSQQGNTPTRSSGASQLERKTDLRMGLNCCLTLKVTNIPTFLEALRVSWLRSQDLMLGQLSDSRASMWLQVKKLWCPFKLKRLTQPHKRSLSFLLQRGNATKTTLKRLFAILSSSLSTSTGAQRSSTHCQIAYTHPWLRR